MSYEEAFKIGSVCDGYVKCTYAELYDAVQKELPGGNRIFPKLFSLQKRFASAEHTIGTTIGLNYEYPIVTADTYVSDTKYVPVYLTTEAAEYINHVISSSKKRSEKWDGLEGLVQAGDMFNVKACAIDWMPTKMDNIVITEKDKNGNTREVKLDDALEAARKKMENAKALLLASGGTLLF